MPLNITEYAKRDDCWELFKDSEFDLPSDSSKFLISKSNETEIIKETRFGESQTGPASTPN